MNRLQAAVAQAALGEVESAGQDTVSLEFEFGPEFIGFDGHFPGAPVLPAVAQVMAGRCALERWRGESLRLRRLSQAKFFKQIGPGERVRAHCRALAQPDSSVIRAQIELRVAAERAAVFTLELERA